MSNFFSNVVEMKPLETAGAIASADSPAEPAMRGSNSTAFRWACGGQFRPAELHPAGVIRAFTGDGDVVDVAFAQAGAGDAHELRLLMQLGKVFRPDISHRRPQAAGELMHDVADRALVRHLTLDALRHQLERVLDVLLEVTIGGAARHRAYRA